MNDVLRPAATTVSRPPAGDKALLRHPAALGSVVRFFRGIARGIGALLLPSNASFDVLRILWLSAAFAMFFLYVACFRVHPGAADYELWADILIGQNGQTADVSLVWRDIGYSLLLILGGFPWTHSFIGITIISAGMAIAMPVLAYFTLRPWFPRAAYWAALVSIVSLAPLLMFKVIHHDHGYNFFLVAVAWSLGRYGATKRPVHLYALALFSFALTLMRLLGQAVYPALALLSFVQWRANLKHVLASAALFVLCLAAYSSYRSHVLSGPQSALGQQVLGQQIFLNMYLQLADSNLTIGPDAGPNTKRLIEQLREHLLPSPAQSPAVLRMIDGGTRPEFLRERFTRYSADELIRELLTHPNREYYGFIAAYIDDHLLLLTCIEMALQHPGYVAGYTLRNALMLLSDPGYAYGRNRVPPLTKEGNSFPFSGGGGQLGYNIGDRTPEPALTEAGFLSVLHQGAFIRNIYFFIEDRWEELYHPVTAILFCLMMAAWLSTVIGLAGRLTQAPALLRWSKLWLSEPVIAASAPLSLLLLMNVGVTALLVDPLYRYHHSILMLKIMLAAVGGAVVVHLLQARVQSSRTIEPRGHSRVAAPNPARWQRHMAISAMLLGIALTVGFGGWAWSMRAVATETPPDGTIRIVSATYGANCGAERNNDLQHVHSLCVGKERCVYAVYGRILRDPAPGCAKDFRIEWSCSAGGRLLSRIWSEHDPMEISCP